MFLKNYQIRVVSELKNFLQVAKENRVAIDAAAKHLPVNLRQSLNYVQTTFEAIGKQHNDNCRNGLGNYYPRFIIKVPTGGGKTVLGVEAIREYQTLFAQKRTGLIVWIVPKDIIYTQTINRLRDKSDPYRQLLDQASGGKTIIAEKGQKLSRQDIEENLVVLFVMIQSISRANTAEALKVFQDSGGYDNFFPADNRYDLHSQWLSEVPNLDTIWRSNDQAQLVTSLGNAIRVSKPFIIIDEIHRVFTPTAKQTIDNLNPEMVLGLSATPKEGMNILSIVTGLELKDEEMVKLDLHLIPPSSSSADDWKAMVRELRTHRDQLEVKSIEYRQNTGEYIRPIALIQVERTGKEQRGRGFVHSEDVREFLIQLGVNPSDIAVKSSSTDELENINLYNTEITIRYIITKEALSEGWDCSFAYMLGIIPNVNSNTSITQLVGRILRQPRGRKTKIKELDESYVYYSKGDTRNLLDKVISGFREEGLEDLVSKLKVKGQETVNPTKLVTIKENLRKYEHTLYLPVWLMISENEAKRRFSYAFDIRPLIEFDNFELTQEVIERIKTSLSEENQERKAFAVTIDDKSKAQYHAEEVDTISESLISLGYITRRFTEEIDNTFLARKLAVKWLVIIQSEIGREKVAEHFSYIVSIFTATLKAERIKQEENIFLSHLEQKHLVLAISDEKTIGFKVPDTDTITVTGLPNTYTKNLYTDVEVATMNTLEHSVAQILENQQKLVWWFRNRVSKNFYSIQGWHENRIHPDFILARKKDNDRIELVYILEAKGEHLVNNSDTLYKKKVLDKMTEMKKDGKIIVYQTELNFETLNEAVEAYLIEENKEEEQLRKLMG